MTGEHVQKPAPGSKEALKLGCSCPTVENGFGAGNEQSTRGDVKFWKHDTCILHGFDAVPWTTGTAP